MLSKSGIGVAWVATVAIVLAASGCDCGEAPLRPAPPPGSRVDAFRQADRSVIDVLWVIDNSPTMADVQDNLARNLISFFRYLDEGDVDYQIAVTTTDVGRHGGRLVGAPQILTPDTPDVLAAFRGNVQVGTSGSAKEEGLLAAEMVFQHNDSLLRPDVVCREDEVCDRWRCVPRSSGSTESSRCGAAYVFVVWVSDQDDRSFGEVRYFERFFSQVQEIGNENAVTLAAIVGPDEEIDPLSPHRGCATEFGTAQAGHRYIDLVETTGGIWGSICDASFARTLESMGASAVGLRRKFRLSEVPSLETLTVDLYYPCDSPPAELDLCVEVSDYCDAPRARDRALHCVPPEGGEDGWMYEAETQSIFFRGTSVPGLRARIEAIYLPERKAQEG